MPAWKLYNKPQLKYFFNVATRLQLWVYNLQIFFWHGSWNSSLDDEWPLKQRYVKKFTIEEVAVIDVNSTTQRLVYDNVSMHNDWQTKQKKYIFINVKYTCIAHHLLDKKTTYIFDLNIFKLQCYWKQVYISLIYFFPWKRCWQNKLKGQKKSTLASVKISKVFVSLLHNNRLEIKNKTLLSHHLSGSISLYILEHNNEPPFPLLVNNSTESSQNRSPIQL